MKSKFIIAGIILLLLGVCGFIYLSVSSKPVLNIVLRCPPKASGKLSAAEIFPDGAKGKARTFELGSVCSGGSMQIDDYRQGNAVEFILERENGEKHKIISIYGEDIESDPNGFFVVLKITETPPFIANDSI